jgi:hypothetical protein
MAGKWLLGRSPEVSRSRRVAALPGPPSKIPAVWGGSSPGGPELRAVREAGGLARASPEPYYPSSTETPKDP